MCGCLFEAFLFVMAILLIVGVLAEGVIDWLLSEPLFWVICFFILFIAFLFWDFRKTSHPK